MTRYIAPVLILALAEGCDTPRAPVLACRDALRAGGGAVELITARSDEEIDAAFDRGPLVVASATDAQLRAVLRRMVRRYAPAPSRRPASLPGDRTVPDLPAVGILPLGPAGDGDLVSRLGLPRSPASVAAAVLGGATRRLDLLRTDGGSVTLDGALIGGMDGSGRAVPFAAQVNVDDAVLSDGREPLIAAVVANAGGYAVFDGLPLVTAPDPADGSVDVAVALPVLRGKRTEVEVRRARGRAVAVTPSGDVPFLDDGVAGTLSRRRTWWMERSVWAVYTPQHS